MSTIDRMTTEQDNRIDNLSDVWSFTMGLVCRNKSLAFVVVIGVLMIPTARPEEVCQTQSDIAFVVDSSGSINDDDPNNWDRVRTFIALIVEQLDIGEDRTRVALIKFSNQGNVQFLLNQHYVKEDLTRIIRNTGYGGGNTNTSGGLYYMLTEVFAARNGDRPNVRDTAVVITDGKATRDTHLTIPYADEAKARGITVIAVGIGSAYDEDELEAIASRPSAMIPKTVYKVNNFTALLDILEHLVTQTCMVLTTPPTTSRPLGDAFCQANMDFVVILDASGSVQYSNFNRMKMFTQDLVEDLGMDKGRVRFGLQTFANNEQLEFHLNRYSRRIDAINHVRTVTYFSGTTNTAAALQFAYQTMFTPANGDRDDAQNVILLITDGSSNNAAMTIRAAREAKKRGIHIFVVAVGGWLNIQEINSIATYPYQENRFELRNFDALNEEFLTRIRELFCSTVNECASNPCRNSLECIDRLGSYQCVCRENYGGTTCSDRCEDPADIVFAMDASGSIGRENFERMGNFFRSVVGGLRIGNANSQRRSRVGLLSFADQATVAFHLNEYTNKFDIQNAFPPNYSRGSTNMAAALKLMREEMFTAANGDQPGARNIGIIITNDKSDDEQKAWEEAVRLRERGVHVIVIGVGDSLKMRELEAVASDPNTVGQNILVANSFETLPSIEQRLVSALCNNVDECSSGPCLNNGRCDDLLNSFKCQCRTGFSGARCEKGCSNRLDIVFVLDKSGSIRQERFPDVKNFIGDVIEQLDIGEDRTQVGVVSWADTSDTDFNLNRYSSKQDIKSAVQYIQFDGGRTNTAAALARMRNQLFTPANGDRANAPNIAIVLTDGNSNINPDDTITEAIASKVSGVHVITVSVGTLLGRQELRAMASEVKDENMFSVDSYDDLGDLVNALPRAVCNDVNECQSGPCLNGGTCLDRLGRYICQCRDGYGGQNCQQRCTGQLDLVLVLDLSGSTERHHQKSLQFAEQVVQGLDVNSGRVKVALTSYGDTAVNHFYLNSYTDKESVLIALSILPNKGRTNTADALREARVTHFRTERGERNGIPNVIVLVTDGKSNVMPENTEREATRLKDDGAAIYVVGIGNDVNLDEINAIAGQRGRPGDDFVYLIPEEDSVGMRASDLTSNLCQ